MLYFHFSMQMEALGEFNSQTLIINLVAYQ